MSARLSTGVPGLDEHLGGGLLPGTLTVVLGATGIGKTQLGLSFAQAGAEREGRRGVVFDMSARGDSQSHAEYAQRLFDWRLQPASLNGAWDWPQFFESARAGRLGDWAHVFDYSGRRVTRRDVDPDQWHLWQEELNRKLRGAIGFLYGSFLGGARRVVIDGVEPADRPGESIQFDLVEYLYHQVVRKEFDWVARDLLRESFRQHADLVERHKYDERQVSCLLLATSKEMTLDDLIARPLDEGDALSNANTLILMGKTRDGNRLGRGLVVAKHRGSPCSDEILPYRIGEAGIEIET